MDTCMLIMDVVNSAPTTFRVNCRQTFDGGTGQACLPTRVLMGLCRARAVLRDTDDGHTESRRKPETQSALVERLSRYDARRVASGASA